MRRYCVRFLERVRAVEQPEGAKRHFFREPRCRMHDYWLGEALGVGIEAIGVSGTRSFSCAAVIGLWSWCGELGSVSATGLDRS